MPGILIVDDDPTFRALAARLLEEAGLEVEAMVGTAAAALTSAHKLQPEAMLVDVGLPDRDGIDLARELAGLPWQPRIVLTSTDRDAVAGALEDGSPPFIAKEDLPDAPLLRSLLGGGR